MLADWGARWLDSSGANVPLEAEVRELETTADAYADLKDRQASTRRTPAGKIAIVTVGATGAGKALQHSAAVLPPWDDPMAPRPLDGGRDSYLAYSSTCSSRCVASRPRPPRGDRREGHPEGPRSPELEPPEDDRRVLLAHAHTGPRDPVRRRARNMDIVGSTHPLHALTEHYGERPWLEATMSELLEAEAAFERMAWADAYERYVAAGLVAPLAPSQLECAASAAHLTGRDPGRRPLAADRPRLRGKQSDGTRGARGLAARDVTDAPR